MKIDAPRMGKQAGGLTGGQVERFGNLVQRVFERGQQKGAE